MSTLNKFEWQFFRFNNGEQDHLATNQAASWDAEITVAKPNKFEWEFFKFNNVEQDHLTTNQLAFWDAEIKVAKNEISALEEHWVDALQTQWGNVYQIYQVPFDCTVTPQKEAVNYQLLANQLGASLAIGYIRAAASNAINAVPYLVEVQEEAQIAEGLAYDGLYACTLLKRAAKVVDDICSAVVSCISFFWQQVALLRRFLRLAVSVKWNLLKTLSTSSDFISIVVNQANWFVRHGFHPPAQLAKGN